MRCHRLGLVFSALLAGLPVGCAQPDEAGALPAVTYIGAVESTGTRIAIVRNARGVQAYVCGQGPTLESHTRWFEGAFEEQDGGLAELESDGWHLLARVTAAGMIGELSAPSGESLRWTAERTPGDSASEVGLYQSYELGCRTGVIVWRALPGPECSAQGVWCDDDGRRGQVTPADCTAAGRLLVRGEREGDAFDLVVERVQSP